MSCFLGDQESASIQCWIKGGAEDAAASGPSIK